MKRTFFIFYFLFFIFYSQSQNLVTNGDFESYTICPSATGNSIALAFPWKDPTNATSDYYNACAPVSSLCSVPDQTIGVFQYARSGVAYGAFYGSQSYGNNYREYIQIKLTNPLQADSCYAVEFYVNLINRTTIAINNIGAYISTTAVTGPPHDPLNLTPQILIPGNPVISDTLNWVKVSGVYHALGGEFYLTIGNFKDDTNTTYQVIDTSSSSYDVAYYYVDDVSLTKLVNCDSTLGIHENKDEYSFNLFPNPNNGNMTLSYVLDANTKATFEIYDITGKQIIGFKLDNSANELNIDNLKINSGIYFYKVIVNEKIVKTEKLVIAK